VAMFFSCGRPAFGANSERDMLNFLPSKLIGVIVCLLLSMNGIFWTAILFSFSLVKLLLPFKPVRKVVDRILTWIAESWVSGNSAWMRLTQKTQWDVAGIDGLRRNGWYLVVSNHQSWADIFVLQHLFNRKIPLLKFFIKWELMWVPVMGLAWWALDFPFMRRHTEEYLTKHPEARGKDLATTRKACEKFKLIPTSVMNFLEGTRFTRLKHEKQRSPFKRLLKPKAGGIALALNAMGDQFQSLIDVTIVYPDGAPAFWDFLCGKVRRVVVRARKLPIDRRFCEGEYSSDAGFRGVFQDWLQQWWVDKDLQIEALLRQARDAG